MNQELVTAKEIKSFEKYQDIYDYQGDLTKDLDILEDDFTQEIINEIVLWKVNRYARLKQETLQLLNQISKNNNLYSEEFIIQLLTSLLETKGIKIAMASTILRFKNPEVFQIIDQRVYRILYGNKMSTTTKKTEIISIYLKYLDDLRAFCSLNHITFNDSDRILYLADKDVNKEIKLEN